jgi:ABC-type multidrug transport system fused ATPase/permease subunit
VLEAVVREPLLILGSLAFMIFISPGLTAFVLILIVCTGSIVGILGKNLRKQSGDAQSRMGSLIAVLDESLAGMRVIKGFGAERYQSARFGTENRGYGQLLTRLLRRKDLASPLSEFLGIVIVSVLLIYGSARVFEGEMSSQMFFVFLYAFFNVIEPSKAFSSALYSIKKGMGALERVEQVLRADVVIKERPDAKIIATLASEISFEHVHFSYPNAVQPTLTDIDFSIKKGEMVALVGPSGAGKSTIADLLPRFYDVAQGAIKIDGHDVRDLTFSSLRNLFGIVSQEAILFHDSVRNNLIMGALECTDAQVESALRSANAWDFVAALPEGMDTTIGDRGLKLSGGQRQRLTIARALLRNPEVLILDEATSALDSESEKLVQDAFDKLLFGRTSLVVAHRLSTVMHADKIIVLAEGRVEAVGRHEELMERSALYARLVKLQAL